MNEHDHDHDTPQAPVPLMPDDAGSRALADALAQQLPDREGDHGAARRAVLWLGFFTVGPQERAVILRFGKPVGVGRKSAARSGSALVMAAADR
jgi:hypothetical protein